MIDCKILFNYFRQCPFLTDLLSIAGESEKGNNIILPQGASPSVQYNESIDVCGNYKCVVEPYPSVYEDFQINCFVGYSASDTSPPDSNSNVMRYEQVCSVCKWITQQNEIGNFPQTGERIVAMECNPFVPQISFVEAETNTVGYYITIRVRYLNREQRRVIEYECEN